MKETDVRNLSSPTGMTRRASYARRLSSLLAVGAALLCCAGVARAQGDEGRGVRQPSFNVRPLEDVARRAKQLVEQGKLGRETTLDVSATAELAADGSLKRETVNVVWASAADETVTSLSDQLVNAVSDSRMLSALEGAKAVRLGLRLDGQNVSVLLAAELPSALEAQRYAEGYDMLRRVGLASKRATDEGALYEWLRFASDGKMFKMTFEGPRGAVARMVADALERSAAKRWASEPRR